MKIAFVTEDGERISAHFGRAPYVVVVTFEDGNEVTRETRDKPHHAGKRSHKQHDEPQATTTNVTLMDDRPVAPRHGQGHGGRFQPMKDCSVLVTRGIGEHAISQALDNGLQVFLVAEKTIDEALTAYLNGTLQHDERRIHRH